MGVLDRGKTVVRCDALDTSPVAPMSARFVRELAAESILFAVRFGLVRAFVSFVLFRLQCDDTENRVGTESAPLQVILITDCEF